MVLTKGVSVLDEVKEKGCPARERESSNHIHFPVELTTAVEHFNVPVQTVQKKQKKKLLHIMKSLFMVSNQHE